jgi:hypothetical protein
MMVTARACTRAPSPLLRSHNIDYDIIVPTAMLSNNAAALLQLPVAAKFVLLVSTHNIHSYFNYYIRLYLCICVYSRHF